MGKRVVALMGSYRHGGVVDTTTELVLAAARARGAVTEKIVLIDEHVEFCGNCRACMQQPGAARGTCVIEDDVASILDRLTAADAIVLGAPVNFGDVNARTRQFLERMVPLATWPPGAPSPKLRDPRKGKRAVLITSSAAPGWMTRYLARPLKTLKRMAGMLGARPVDSIVVGLVPAHQATPSDRSRRAAERAAGRLVA